MLRRGGGAHDVEARLLDTHTVIVHLVVDCCDAMGANAVNTACENLAPAVEQITGGKALPAEVVQQVVAKTDGVPLFVEELTRTILESDLLREREDHYELSRPLPPMAIPATLHDSLMARLDRLGPAREIIQVGSPR